MLSWMSEKLKLAKIYNLWVDATNLDLGDGGQINKRANLLIKTTGMRVEDAWLTSVVGWIQFHPNLHDKMIMSLSVMRFLEIHGSSAALSPECKAACISVIGSILEGDNLALGAVNDSLGLPDLFNPILPSTPRPQLSLAEAVELAKDEPDCLEEEYDVDPNWLVPKKPKAASGITKSEALKKAVEYTYNYLDSDGYSIKHRSDVRGDVPTIIAIKEGREYHFQVHVNQWGEDLDAPQFILDRLMAQANQADAAARLVRLEMFNCIGETDQEKREVTLSNVGFKISVKLIV